MEAITESEIVSRAQTGDKEAIETLFASLRKPLFSFVYRMVTHRQDAEDLTQEIFVRALRGLANYRGGSQFKTWLFGIATHACLDFLREKQRWRVEAQKIAEEEGMKSSAHNQRLSQLMSDPGFIFDIKEHVAYCLACIGRTLPAEEQAAILLRDMFGFTGEESAHMLGVSEPVLRHRLSSARSSMTKHYDGLCQLINKTGICDQCRSLRDFSAQGHKGSDLVSIEAQAGQTLLDARFAIAKTADLENGSSSQLHTQFFEWLTLQETGASAWTSASASAGDSGSSSA